MPFDLLLGVGREPQVAGTRRSYDIPTQTFTLTDLNLDDEATVTVDGERMLYAVWISITPLGNATTRNALNPRAEVFIDNDLVATYTLVATIVQNSEWKVNEIVPYQKELWGQGHSLRIRVAIDDDTTGNGYALSVSASALTIII